MSIKNCEKCRHCSGFETVGDIANCVIYGKVLIKNGDCPSYTEMTDTMHPSRYNGNSSHECIDVLKEWMSIDEYRGFCRGNAIKYLCRLGKRMIRLKNLIKHRYISIS